MKQHEIALAHGNEIRLARAQIKREVKAGEASLSELLIEPQIPECLNSMLVESFLDLIPRLQSKTIQKTLHEVPINLTATLGKTTYRQRRKLAGLVGAWEAKQQQESGRRARPHGMARRHVHLSPLDSNGRGDNR